MKRVYERPLMTAELFEANEYVATCYSYAVGCEYDKANSYEQSIGNASKSWNGTWTGQYHAAKACGNSENQYLVDSNGDKTIDVMQEYKKDGIVGTNGQRTNWLTCTLYSDASYTTVISASSVEPGEYIYWTTSASDGRVWHHQGQTVAVASTTINRS